MHPWSAYSGPSHKQVLSLSALSLSTYSLLVSRIKSYFLSTLSAQTDRCNISCITSTITTTNSYYIFVQFISLISGFRISNQVHSDRIHTRMLATWQHLDKHFTKHQTMLLHTHMPQSKQREPTQNNDITITT
jgi:hypothetical protein